MWKVRKVSEVSKVSNIIVELGPRMLMVGKEALGTSDNISIEATEEELEKLKSAYEIRPVKMLGESGAGGH